MASPRLINAGQGYRDAPDPEHIYALFPGTTTNAAYFAQNDAIWLGRVPTAQVLDRSKWTFYAGHSAGRPSWTPDDTIAVPVFEHPLMTATQQVTYHPYLKVYMMPVWSWCDPDGNPREQLSAANTGGPFWGYNSSQGKDAHDRSQLTVWEACEPWGPWNLAYRTDDWRGPDGSSGAYTPVFQPAWIKSKTEMWMSFTQCCPSHFPAGVPPNHYNYTYQRLTLELF